MEPQTICINNMQLLCLACCICYWNSNTYLCKKSCSDPCSDSCSWICSPICLVFSLRTVEVSCGACSVPGVWMVSFLFSHEPSRLSSRKRTFKVTARADNAKGSVAVIGIPSASSLNEPLAPNKPTNCDTVHLTYRTFSKFDF